MPKLAHHFACSLAVALSACATEVHSLTRAEAPLDSSPQPTQVQFSYLPDEVDMSPPDKLEIRFEGQPVVVDFLNLAIDSSDWLMDVAMQPGTGRFEFMREGATVLTSEPLTLGPTRFNHLIVYGAPDALKLVVLSAPREARRINAVNLRRDRQDVSIRLGDGAGKPFGEAKLLEYGETWSQLADPDAYTLLTTIGDDEQLLSIPCNPNLALVAFVDDDALYPVHLGPDSPDYEAAGCFVPTCDCEDRFGP